MNTYNNIIVTGSISWDIIMDFPKKFIDYLQPEMLHQINVSFVVNKLEKQLGGTATNISYAASLCAKALGTPAPVKILGAFGKDSVEHISFFKKNNINIQGVVRDMNLFNACGTVITDRKDNQIWGYYYGACERGKDAPYEESVDTKSFMIISANHPDAFLKAQSFAIKNKVDYIYDAGMALSWITKKDLLEGVLQAKYMIGNDYEVALICKTIGKSVTDLAKRGITIITTLGEHGVRAQNAQMHYDAPSCKGLSVVDPTGAGDAWRGGFMAALIAGKSFEECLSTGNAMASFAIERYGTVTYTVAKSVLLKRIASCKVAKFSKSS